MEFTKKPAAKRKNPLGDLRKLIAGVPAVLEKLEAEIVATAAEMDSLNRQGLIYATLFWRKHDGKPTYLYLNKTQRSGERVKTYVGRDPREIEKATLAVARAAEYDRLAKTLAELQRRVDDTHDALRAVRSASEGKRATYYRHAPNHTHRLDS